MLRVQVGVADQRITADVLQSARTAERERVTSLSFKKRDKKDRWNVEDTKKFYNVTPALMISLAPSDRPTPHHCPQRKSLTQALRQWGTDFTMVGMMFKGRTRKQVMLWFCFGAI